MHFITSSDFIFQHIFKWLLTELNFTQTEWISWHLGTANSLGGNWTTTPCNNAGQQSITQLNYQLMSTEQAFNFSLSSNYPHFNLHTGHTDIKFERAGFDRHFHHHERLWRSHLACQGNPRKSLRTPLGCGYLNRHIHPPHSQELTSTTPLPTHLPSPCNISLSNKIMENLVCLDD